MTYQPRHEPWAHQAEALSRLEGQKAFALLMEMRTGKTKVTLDDFGRLELEGKASDLLVIAPAGCYRVWEKEMEEHLSEDLRHRLLVHRWRSGAGKREMDALEEFLDNPQGWPRALLMNIEALSTTKRAREVCVDFLELSRRGMVVIDESTTVKNVKAKRTQFIVKSLAPLACYKRILTGLPTPQGPLDLYSQFYFLDPSILGCRKFTEFKARYAITQKKDFGGRWPVEIVVGYRNVQELASAIEPHSYRVRLEDCYELPEKQYTIRHVEPTPEQRTVYNQLKNFACAVIEKEDGELSRMTATIVVHQILRMHQVLCGHYVEDETKRVVELPENRTAELINLFGEFSGKAIIWASYDHNIHKIVSALRAKFGEASVARFWGGNMASREEEEREFLTNPSCRFMVATPAAGGRGRKWMVASMVVYYSNTANLEHRSQSEERAQGVGKSDSVLYVDMMVPDSVEVRFVKALREKIDIASVITRDNYKEWLV